MKKPARTSKNAAVQKKKPVRAPVKSKALQKKTPAKMKPVTRRQTSKASAMMDEFLQKCTIVMERLNTLMDKVEEKFLKESEGIAVEGEENQGHEESAPPEELAHEVRARDSETPEEEEGR